MDDFKCRVCGGDMKNDYKAGLRYCTHCGNKLDLSKADEHYKDYENIIKQLNSAETAALSDNNDLKTVNQALLAYKNALTACSLSKPMAQVEELKLLCREEVEKYTKRSRFLAAKEHFENKAYTKAYEELKALGDYAEAAELAEKCAAEIQKERIKHLPYSIFAGLILPAILFFVLKEKTDISIAAALAAALTAAGLNIFVIYRGGALATLLEILSYILLVPLLIFALLAYVFHLSTALSLGIAIGAPLIIVILLAVLAERE